MKRALRSAFVLTVAGAAGCSSTSSESAATSAPSTSSPTAAGPANGSASVAAPSSSSGANSSTQPVASNAGATASAVPIDQRQKVVDAARFTKLVHATDTEGRNVFGAGLSLDACRVFVPLPKAEQTELAEARAVEVPCEGAMRHPSFHQCNGRVMSDGADACACFEGGNPPPPAWMIACPDK